MRIALYGPTGAGKSTLAAAIQRLYKLKILSTGDYVRRMFPKEQSKTGFSAREEQIREYVMGEYDLDNLVLDGFPRHHKQLAWLYKAVDTRRLVHVFLTVSEEEAKRRIELRGRADMTNFTITFRAQALEVFKMRDFLQKQKANVYTVHQLWEPDGVARWLFNEEEATGLRAGLKE